MDTERDRALVAAMAEVAEALTRLVSAYGRVGTLEAVGTDILRTYGSGVIRLGAEMAAHADRLDGNAAPRSSPGTDPSSLTIP